MNTVGDTSVLERLLDGKGDVTVFLSGGGQACIYQAGVLRVFEELALQKNITAIYGNSGGTIMGWNLLGNGIAKNTPCMYEEHVRVRFVDLKRGKSLIDTAGLSNRMLTTRRIDFESFKQSSANLYSGMTDYKTGLHTFQLVPKDTIEDAIPFVFASFAIPHIGKLRVWVNGEQQTDGAFSDPLPIARIAPESENLLVIMSRPFEKVGVLPSLITNRFSGYTRSVLEHPQKFNQGIDMLADLTAKPGSKTLVIYPDFFIKPECIDPDLLRSAETTAYEYTRKLLNNVVLRSSG